MKMKGTEFLIGKVVENVPCSSTVILDNSPCWYDIIVEAAALRQTDAFHGVLIQIRSIVWALSVTTCE